MPSKLTLLIFLSSCSIIHAPMRPDQHKEFSQGEVILGTQLLTKIYDQEMAPIKCVQDLEEASLLLRTINPRMELVQDNIEAMLDNKDEVRTLIQNCDQNCTCSFMDDILKEHVVFLEKDLRKILDEKKKQKDLNSCLNYGKETFCDGELYKELSLEKVEFSYDE
jgi:glutamine synthetase adenylyltransferase